MFDVGKHFYNSFDCKLNKMTNRQFKDIKANKVVVGKCASVTDKSLHERPKRGASYLIQIKFDWWCFIINNCLYCLAEHFNVRINILV